MRERILKWLAKDYIAELERSFTERVDQRVAKVLSERDPFEPLLQHFKGTFSEEYERPEERLNQQGQISMKLWGYQQTHDPSFKYVIEWIANKAGNQLINKGLPSIERQLFARAQISTMLLLRKEARRLSSLYEELMGKEDEFLSDSLVD
jgi:hypothetical protein